MRASVPGIGNVCCVGESLWSASAEELLGRTASADPTPGGGSIAAICGSFGVALIQMAVAVSGAPALEHYAGRLASLQQAIVPAADGDVHDFDAVMAAYRLPKGDDAEIRARARAIETTSIAATDRPLNLVAHLVDALALSHELEALVKPRVISDVLAGRDVVIGSARAAIRTADINIDQLSRASSPAASELRAHRDALVRKLEETS